VVVKGAADRREIDGDFEEHGAQPGAGGGEGSAGVCAG
jgi:hypothetical protein